MNIRWKNFSIDDIRQIATEKDDWSLSNEYLNQLIKLTRNHSEWHVGNTS
ncbi:hypothetical protein [Lederbergia citri]|uniref:Uncharacterized protein n=1 Tax=Lederbergia citri TaxID=2833580 RepID=A0A942TD88_9BACI|nr:hypothetical protein [Lederbergia citri]MBS4195690.1 hypothetical protein [Lederbergia citri]